MCRWQKFRGACKKRLKQRASDLADLVTPGKIFAIAIGAIHRSQAIGLPPPSTYKHKVAWVSDMSWASTLRKDIISDRRWCTGNGSK